MNPRLMRPYKEGVPASLLLRFDGTNGSTSFVDSSPNALTVTAYGGAEIGTAQGKWGGASMYVADSANDGVTFHADATDQFQFVGDYTIEFWLYRVSGADDTSLYLTYDGSSYHAINIDGSNFNLYFNSTSPDAVIAHSIGLDAWAHVALVRSGDQVTLYVDGVSIGSATSSVTHGYATPTLARTGGGNIGSEMYIDDLRVVRGLAVYTGPFIPPSAPLSPYARQVAVSREASLLLHMDGSNGSTTFTDSSQNALTVTANGDAEISTAQSKWGGSSAYFDGNDYAEASSAALALGSSDFTIECWVYDEDITTGHYWFRSDLGQAQEGVIAGTDTANAEGCWIWLANEAINFGDVFVDNGLAANVWHHVAITRSGDTFRVFLDGAVIATHTAATPGDPVESGTNGFRIGGANAGNQTMTGYIDDLRIVKGLAVYTGPFVPPTGPLPAIATPQPIQAQASLLLHFDGANGSTAFTDSSQNALTVTANGDAEISTAQSKWGGSSLYLDGSSSLDIADSSAFNFGTGDFTIEFWLHMDQTQSSNQYVYDLGANNAPVAVQSMYGGLAAFDWGIQYAIASVAVTDNTWAHFAIVRQGGTVTLYKDGVSAGSSADSQNYSSTTLRIGQYGGGNSEGLYGYIDDLRIVKGLAVYTGNFTPPTGPLSATVTPQ